jgi:hypothetical protein
MAYEAPKFMVCMRGALITYHSKRLPVPKKRHMPKLVVRSPLLASDPPLIEILLAVMRHLESVFIDLHDILDE